MPACGLGEEGHRLGAVYHLMRVGGSELFANQCIRLAAAGRYHLEVVEEDGTVHLQNGWFGQLSLGCGG